ncbi:hypothetical protein JEP40_12810 [Proteus vulgaris]|uniref:hypothetical protein n=1 Tax=Morganellaceae TaxID=1903414 RepID=UPI0011C8AB64|nr:MULTISPECIES: hypothetical protein [Morganellaceae]MBI6529992.1 hypothetical protein [Proteus vulgaris]TXM53764.1 hypothetical protein FT667_15555 [Providencia rettgeri]TXM77722.1 hypothetical protein FT666_15935 [Providencia rettgeri]
MKSCKMITGILFSLVLSGCANNENSNWIYNNEASKPVVENGSEALKIAKSIGLNNLDDDADNYTIFAVLVPSQEGNSLKKIKEPIVVSDTKGMDQLREIISQSKNAVNVVDLTLAATVNPVFGLLAFDTSTPEERAPMMEGRLLVTEWGSTPLSFSDQLLKSKRINSVFDKYLSNAIKAEVAGNVLACNAAKFVSVTENRNISDQNLYVNVHQAPFTNLKYSYNYTDHECVHYLHDTGRYEEEFKKISVELGPETVLFLPSNLKSEPKIIRNGQVYKFR